MARKAKPEWITAKEATAILRANNGRPDITDSYIRSLARLHKVQVTELDGRTNGYLRSDVENITVRRKDQGKGDTRAARKAGSRRKRNKQSANADAKAAKGVGSAA